MKATVLISLTMAVITLGLPSAVELGVFLGENFSMLLLPIPGMACLFAASILANKALPPSAYQVETCLS